MRRAICPGSFDPVTNGHLDIFERASQMFDEIVISVFHNPGKEKAMFSMEERVEMLRMATAHIPNARVTCFSGLLNEFCRQEKAPFIVRGLRAFSDFEYEFQRALLIKKIDNNLETVFPACANWLRLAAASTVWCQITLRCALRSCWRKNTCYRKRMLR